MQRKDGFYWVKIYKGWVVAYWSEARGIWSIPGDGSQWYERNIDEINETPLTPPKD